MTKGDEEKQVYELSQGEFLESESQLKIKALKRTSARDGQLNCGAYFTELNTLYIETLKKDIQKFAQIIENVCLRHLVKDYIEGLFSKLFIPRVSMVACEDN